MKDLTRNLVVMTLLFLFIFSAFSGALIPIADAVKDMDTPVAAIENDTYHSTSPFPDTPLLILHLWYQNRNPINWRILPLYTAVVDWMPYNYRFLRSDMQQYAHSLLPTRFFPQSYICIPYDSIGLISQRFNLWYSAALSKISSKFLGYLSANCISKFICFNSFIIAG